MLTAQQQQIRLSGIGASETAAILGLDSRQSIHDIYDRKTMPNRFVEDDETDVMALGSHMEPFIADRYTKRTGRPVTQFVNARGEQIPWTLRSAEFPWLLASPDRLVPRSIDGRLWTPAVNERDELTNPEAFDRGLEIKAVFFSASEWGDGDDEIPLRTIVQTQANMLVSGIHTWDVSPLSIGRPRRIYTLTFDQDLANLIVEATRQFWYQHVLAVTPPPIDGRADEALRRRYPEVLRPELQVAETPELNALAGRLLEVKAQKEHTEELYAGLSNQMRDVIGASGGIKGVCDAGHWRATWSQRRGSTSWKSVAEALAADPTQRLSQLAERFRGGHTRTFKIETYDPSQQRAKGARP